MNFSKEILWNKYDVDDIYKRMPNVFTNVNNKNAEIWVEFSDPIPVNYTLNIYYFCA